MRRVFAFVLVCFVASLVQAADAKIPTITDQEKAAGFVSIFDGKTHNGWHGAIKGYGIENGVLFCKKKGGGYLFTDKEYADFAFRFEFRVEKGGNNGVAIRMPDGGGTPAFVGMEIQILDDDAERYKNLKDYQFNGSVYGVVSAKRGHLKPAGQWNSEEIMCKGGRVKVTLNGTVIVDADVSKIEKTIDNRPHPGLKRKSGFLGFCGHGSFVEFRNLRVKELPTKAEVKKKVNKATPSVKLPSKEAADGFVNIFDGKTLNGWQGAIKGYAVENGVLVCKKKGGGNLLTKKQYANFILQFDYKLVTPGANNGVGIRAPSGKWVSSNGMEIQVIDDRFYADGKPFKLKSYQLNGSVYGLVPAKTGFDKPVGQWNREEILCDGSHIRVTLNRTIIVDADLSKIEKSLDRYKRDGRKRKTGFIGFLGHGARAEYRNIRVKELKADVKKETDDGFVSIFDGKTLDGWKGLGGDKSSYYVEDGVLICKKDGHTHIVTEKEYTDFILRLEIKMEPGGNNGIGLRTKLHRKPHIYGMESQVLDDQYYTDGKPIKLKDYQHHGSIYGVVPAKTGHLKPTGQWNVEEIVCKGSHVKVTLNGTVIVDVDLDKVKRPTLDNKDHPGLKYKKGHIGLHAHGNYGARVFFRKLRVKEL